MKFERTFLLLIVYSMLCALPTQALDPQSCTITNARSDVVDRSLSDREFYRGQKFAFTNSILLSSDAGGVVQDLTGLTVLALVGGTNASACFTGCVQNATAGVWSASFIMPTNWWQPNVWIEIADTNLNTYLYPRAILRTISAP